MNKNFFLTVTALAIMATVGYAAYTNGSVTDLSSVINSRLSGVTSVGSNYLGALVTTTGKVGGTADKPSLNIFAVSGQKGMDMLPAQTAVVFARYVLDARKSSEDIAIFNLTFSPTVSKGGYVDDIQKCQLVSEGNALISNQVGTLFGGDVSFRLHNENADPASPNSLGFLVTKGSKSVISLRCDVALTPNSASGSVFKWTVKKARNDVASAIGMFSSKAVLVGISSPVSQNATLRTVGDLSVSLDSSTPVGRKLSCGSSNNNMVKIKLASSFEDIYVKKLNLIMSGTATFTAVTRFTLYDGNSSVVIGEGAFGTNKTGEVVLAGQGFLVPALSSKSLSIWADLSVDTINNKCQVGKTVGIDYANFQAVGAITATNVASTTKNTAKLSGKKSTLAK
ncbi:MAG: hypothetical protein AAB501_01890 [Patescibacteria group bacterium]